MLWRGNLLAHVLHTKLLEGVNRLWGLFFYSSGWINLELASCVNPSKSSSEKSVVLNTLTRTIVIGRTTKHPVLPRSDDEVSTTYSARTAASSCQFPFQKCLVWKLCEGYFAGRSKHAFFIISARLTCNECYWIWTKKKTTLKKLIEIAVIERGAEFFDR